MLKVLKVKNLILMESVEVLFQPGLNIISGETGSGKSALMTALALIAGERADQSMIRNGHEEAMIEALFDISNYPDIKAILNETGILNGEEIIIRRIVAINGKNRIFVNDHLITLQLLRNIGTKLVLFSGQHAHQDLFQSAYHRLILDDYAQLKPQVNQFGSLWRRYRDVLEEISDVEKNVHKRARDLERYEQEIEEITSVQFMPEEDEELFSEYTELVHAEENSESLRSLLDLLHGDEGSICSLSKQCLTRFSTAIRSKSNLNEAYESFQRAVIEIGEVTYILEKEFSNLRIDPRRLHEVNQRLQKIEKLKKKYGATYAEVQEYLKEIQERKEKLENTDHHLHDLMKERDALKKQCDQLAQELTIQRSKAAKELSQAITQELRQLNIPEGLLEVTLSQESRTQYGDDSVSFLLAPNKGEPLKPLKTAASGGELSRFLLALHTILSHQKQVPLMVFDEVDANIGGTTATKVGETLKKLGKKNQVIAITHFAQVATHADWHLRIRKHEREGRTFTLVESLQKEMREKEIMRMLGKTEVLQNT
ncbi:MAG: DNA repair protein RecN [Chlamydiales bacterium]